MANENNWEGRAKKEVGRLDRERKHLHQNLAGIKDMPGLPDVLFVVDSNKEAIAVKEARKLGIPVVALIDTDSDPDEVDIAIPGNDDAMRAIELILKEVGDAVVEGKAGRQAKDDVGEREGGGRRERPRRQTATARSEQEAADAAEKPQPVEPAPAVAEATPSAAATV